MSEPTPTGSLLRTAFFVDGFNVYHSLLSAAKLLPGASLKWLDLPALLGATLPLLDTRARLVAIHYFTAEELDFILNYDTRLHRGFGGQVKYRLGRDTESEEET